MDSIDDYSALPEAIQMKKRIWVHLMFPFAVLLFFILFKPRVDPTGFKESGLILILCPLVLVNSIWAFYSLRKLWLIGVWKWPHKIALIYFVIWLLPSLLGSGILLYFLLASVAA